MNLPSGPFWALRFGFENEWGYGPTEPGLICAISTLPSSLPIPDASFTLGPKFALDTHELSPGIAPGSVQLTIHPPLECASDMLHEPVYLHTAPILRMAGGYHPPIEPEVSRHQLDPESLRKFITAASSNIEHARDAWFTRTKSSLGEWLARHTPANQGNDLAQPREPSNIDPTYIFGELNNPHTYCFNFFPKGTGYNCDYPSPIYEQMVLYAQLCKDYRWPGVEPTIDWVRAIRAHVSNLPDNRGVTPPSCVTADVPVHAPVSSLIQQDPAFRAQLVLLTERIALDFMQPPESDDEGDHTSRGGGGGSKGVRSSRTPATHSSSSSRSEGWVWFLTFASPTLATFYPRVPVRRSPPVVVLDMFGIILDREGAIGAALGPWLPLARRCRPDDVREAVKLYIELEALATRELRSNATSLPIIVHAALTALANKLDVPPVSRPALFHKAASCILQPCMIADVDAHVEELSRLGCAIVGLVPFSHSTLATLRPALPPRLCDTLKFFPVPIPVHTAVPPRVFAQLRQWCQQRIPMLRGGCAPEDVLIATTGLGRIVEPATADAHPTVLVWRDGLNIEGPVEYIVGKGQKTPAPSTVVWGLRGLCNAISPMT
ncbi:hypothetical protein TRAPUB_11340 [Trametes pubescens]|uniref:Uncharacterized protein n=1 Tax=Trametes pubescens TaxID=154538 RepID=A0A1M2VWY3_TRAPU|nr:hypothetical protein TRAPUB_11340 [Trametes pubescens]